MIENTEQRKLRIMIRARSYAEGTISLQDFYDQEKAEDDDIRAKERKKLEEMIEEAKRERLREESPDQDPSGFNMTKNEFEELPLWKQSELYREHPEAIRKLLEPPTSSRITKEQYLKMNLREKNRLYQKDPTSIEALIDGTIDFVEWEED